jgi:NhaP-type Na+/H+ or K+/H+ antiporter
VVFALLAIEELGASDPATNLAVAAVTVTVAASILLHGLTAGPGGRRYVQREQAAAGSSGGSAPRIRTRTPSTGRPRDGG